ncbi:hypothetical protein ACQCLI_32125 (plasmid) [Pseudomonas nitroreducens]|uniref:hypothetical protein n=1 Tax=Pseudomonas nitroreducens TaxID=46680 RepID=UPI000367ACB1|nr:hypothetical protein [Pseudomonas nitroreducens]
MLDFIKFLLSTDGAWWNLGLNGCAMVLAVLTFRLAKRMRPSWEIGYLAFSWTGLALAFFVVVWLLISFRLQLGILLS